MKPIRVSPIEGFLQFIKSGLEGPIEQITDKTKQGIIIDTSFPTDTYIWETGIKRPAIEGKWIIVEQYPDKSHAIKGQRKWFKRMEKHPDFPLKDIDLWSLENKMIELTEEQKSLGMRIARINDTFDGLYVGNLLIAHVSNQLDRIDCQLVITGVLRVITFIEFVLDAFLKTDAFDAWASEHCRDQGWKDVDGN